MRQKFAVSRAFGWILGLIAAVVALRCSGGGMQVAGGNTSETGNGRIIGNLSKPDGSPAGTGHGRLVCAPAAAPT